MRAEFKYALVPLSLHNVKASSLREDVKTVVVHDYLQHRLGHRLGNRHLIKVKIHQSECTGVGRQRHVDSVQVQPPTRDWTEIPLDLRESGRGA